MRFEIISDFTEYVPGPGTFSLLTKQPRFDGFDRSSFDQPPAEVIDLSHSLNTVNDPGPGVFYAVTKEDLSDFGNALVKQFALTAP